MFGPSPDEILSLSFGGATGCTGADGFGAAGFFALGFRFGFTSSSESPKSSSSSSSSSSESPKPPNSSGSSSSSSSGTTGFLPKLGAVPLNTRDIFNQPDSSLDHCLRSIKENIFEKKIFIKFSVFIFSATAFKQQDYLHKRWRR